MNLLDALKTSFSHRSLTARSLGKRDGMSEAAVASITMLKVKKFLSLFKLRLIKKLISVKDYTEKTR